MEQKQSMIKHKKVRGRVNILKASIYEGHVIKILMIDKDLFMYLTEYNGDIYMGHIVMSPKEGCKKLTPLEISLSRDMIYTGALATLDMVMKKKVDKETKKIVEVFEKSRKKVQGKKK